MKVLIIGAGIGGNALAFWLSRLGFCDVTVVERHQELRTAGLQVDLRGAGVAALKRMGLEADFRAHAAPEIGLQIVDRKGRRRAFFPANTSGKGAQTFTSEYEILRGELCRLIFAATHKDKVCYLFGRTVEALNDNGPAGVSVTFDDGSVDTFDLVVGTDGVGSRTRRMMLGIYSPSDTSHQTIDPTFHQLNNSTIAYFTIARPAAPGEKDFVARYYMATGYRSVLTRRHNASTIQVYLMTRVDCPRLRNARHGDTATQKAAMDDIFRGAGWETDAILDAMHDSDDFYCERQALIKMESWSRGRVALLGDAAYCPTANGFGTSAAMAGAYILAGEIARRCGGNAEDGEANLAGLEDALGAYEAQLKPAMDKMQRDEEVDKGIMPSSPISVAMFNYFVGAAAFLRLDQLAMKFYGPEKDVVLPDYEDVLKA
jgi:2-polyprenyl-6-methoxyphenol hydroxylase-like FAD-dependent oxidoreductase